jgi:hypothetical protein
LLDASGGFAVGGLAAGGVVLGGVVFGAEDPPEDNPGRWNCAGTMPALIDTSTASLKKCLILNPFL